MEANKLHYDSAEDDWLEFRGQSHQNVYSLVNSAFLPLKQMFLGNIINLLKANSALEVVCFVIYCFQILFRHLELSCISILAFLGYKWFYLPAQTRQGVPQMGVPSLDPPPTFTNASLLRNIIKKGSLDSVGFIDSRPNTDLLQ